MSAAAALYNEPIFRPNRRAYQPPFASALQSGTPLGSGLTQACTWLLDEGLHVPYEELKTGPQTILEDGWLENEWDWLNTINSEDGRACAMYRLLWDTGLFDSVVKMDEEDEETRAALGHAYGAIVQALEGMSALWVGVDDGYLRAILREIQPFDRLQADRAVADLKMLSGLALPLQGTRRPELVLRWKRRGWSQGVWMGERWSEGALLEALQMIAKFIRVKFCAADGKPAFAGYDIQGPLHYLRLILGGGRFSLEEWAPILRLFRNRNAGVVQDTLYGIGECKDILAIRRRWSDVLGASGLFKEEKETFSPPLAQWVKMGDQAAAQLMTDLESDIMLCIPRGLQVRMIGRHFGIDFTQEIDGAYWSEFLAPAWMDRKQRIAACKKVFSEWRRNWPHSMTAMQDYFVHFAMDNAAGSSDMSLRLSFRVRHERFVWAGPVRKGPTAD